MSRRTRSRRAEQVSNHVANAWLNYYYFFFNFVSRDFSFSFRFEYLFFFSTQMCESKEKHENHFGEMKNHVRCAPVKRERKKLFMQICFCCSAVARAIGYFCCRHWIRFYVIFYLNHLTPSGRFGCFYALTLMLWDDDALCTASVSHTLNQMLLTSALCHERKYIYKFQLINFARAMGFGALDCVK